MSGARNFLPVRWSRLAHFQSASEKGRYISALVARAQPSMLAVRLAVSSAYSELFGK
jgi:hypothetical protein